MCVWCVSECKWICRQDAVSRRIWANRWGIWWLGSGRDVSGEPQRCRAVEDRAHPPSPPSRVAEKTHGTHSSPALSRYASVTWLPLILLMALHTSFTLFRWALPASSSSFPCPASVFSGLPSPPPRYSLSVVHTDADYQHENYRARPSVVSKQSLIDLLSAAGLRAYTGLGVDLVVVRSSEDREGYGAV